MFSQGRITKRFFLHKDVSLAIVNGFKYLGIIMSRNGSFRSTKQI